MTDFDGNEKSEHMLFEFKFRATLADQRRVVLAFQTSPVYRDWETLNIAIRNGRGYARDAEYQALCAKQVDGEIALSRMAVKLIDELERERR